jgi:hypothetical protein
LPNKIKFAQNPIHVIPKLNQFWPNRLPIVPLMEIISKLTHQIGKYHCHSIQSCKDSTKYGATVSATVPIFLIQFVFNDKRCVLSSEQLLLGENPSFEVLLYYQTTAWPLSC